MLIYANQKSKFQFRIKNIKNLVNKKIKKFKIII